MMEYLRIPKGSGYNVELNEDRDRLQYLELQHHEVFLLDGFWRMQYNESIDYNVVEGCLMYYLVNHKEWEAVMNNEVTLRFKSEWINQWLEKVE